MTYKKVDRNQPELVKQMRKIPGLTVKHVHMVGEGFGDIVCGHRGSNYIFEIKNPALPPSARRLTSEEEKFHREWTGQIAVVETLDDVLKVLNLK